MAIQLKTARLTVLLDPPRKLAFERACRESDMTPSQVLRHLIRDYVEAHEPKDAAAAPQTAWNCGGSLRTSQCSASGTSTKSSRIPSTGIA